MGPYDQEPAMTEVYKKLTETNPISGHSWTTWGKLIGYEVTGGGWMRSAHATLEGAEKELETRRRILREREARRLEYAPNYKPLGRGTKTYQGSDI